MFKSKTTQQNIIIIIITMFMSKLFNKLSSSLSSSCVCHKLLYKLLPSSSVHGKTTQWTISVIEWVNWRQWVNRAALHFTNTKSHNTSSVMRALWGRMTMPPCVPCGDAWRCHHACPVVTHKDATMAKDSLSLPLLNSKYTVHVYQDQD